MSNKVLVLIWLLCYPLCATACEYVSFLIRKYYDKPDYSVSAYGIGSLAQIITWLYVATWLAKV